MVKLLKLLIYSKDDPAGVNIASHLINEISFKKMNNSHAYYYKDFLLLPIEGSLLDLNIDMENIEWALFLSKHKSESKRTCLTVHTPGNLYEKNIMGGRPNEVAISNPPLQCSLLRALNTISKKLNMNIEVTVEATHHGPTNLNFPVTFIEIGSDENAWRNELLGSIVAKAISNIISSSLEIAPGAVGIGGGHYSDKFTKKILEGALIGHIIPKYAMIEGMHPSMIVKCIERTFGGCTKLYVDWKGTPSHFKTFIKSIKNIEIVKI